MDTLVVNIDNPFGAFAPNIFVPKAWTPNSDGHNDFLFPFMVNIRTLKYFRIFNRWGQLVFETNINGKGWDGIFRGKHQGADVYTWSVEAITIDGDIYKKSGNAVLIR